MVDFHGRLDMHSRWHVKAIINQCCHTEFEHLILNLQGLPFVDSAGLGFLVLSVGWSIHLWVCYHWLPWLQLDLTL